MSISQFNKYSIYIHTHLLLLLIIIILKMAYSIPNLAGQWKNSTTLFLWGKGESQRVGPGKPNKGWPCTLTGVRTRESSRVEEGVKCPSEEHSLRRSFLQLRATIRPWGKIVTMPSSLWDPLSPNCQIHVEGSFLLLITDIDENAVMGKNWVPWGNLMHSFHHFCTS